MNYTISCGSNLSKSNIPFLVHSMYFISFPKNANKYANINTEGQLDQKNWFHVSPVWLNKIAFTPTITKTLQLRKLALQGLALTRLLKTIKFSFSAYANKYRFLNHNLTNPNSRHIEIWLPMKFIIAARHTLFVIRATLIIIKDFPGKTKQILIIRPAIPIILNSQQLTSAHWFQTFKVEFINYFMNDWVLVKLNTNIISTKNVVT